MKFLDADVKRPLACGSAIIHDGNVVVFGPKDSYIETTSTGKGIQMSRRTGVFVVQLEVRKGSRTTKNVRFDKPSTNDITLVFVRPA